MEHTVDDLDRWLETFNRFTDLRAKGGVTGLRVRHGAEDRNLVAIDLDFDSVEQARAFLDHLEREIWPNSPHFQGTPTTRVLEQVDAAV